LHKIEAIVADVSHTPARCRASRTSSTPPPAGSIG